MYFGAEHLIGFFTVVPSAQWYSYLGGGEGGERREGGRGERKGEERGKGGERRGRGGGGERKGEERGRGGEKDSRKNKE